jgi:hypothetical protein
MVRIDQQSTDEEHGGKYGEQNVLHFDFEHGEVGVVHALGQFEQNVTHVVQNEHHVTDALEATIATSMLLTSSCIFKHLYNSDIPAMIIIAKFDP